MISASATFPLLGEPLAIDLVNTRAASHGKSMDLLPTVAALATWLQTQRARLPCHWRPDADDLAALQALRDTLDGLLRARLTGTLPPPRSLATFNRALTDSASTSRLTWSASGPRRVQRRIDKVARRAALVSLLAHDALTVLTGPDAAHLRQCAHPGCILLFIARHPQRRWCCADTCGNRARVARHYRQHKGTGA